MSRSTLPWTSVLPTLAVVAALAACGPAPLAVDGLCGPDDHPGADCARPSVPLTPSGLLILELHQQGLPDPLSVMYHFVTVDLNTRDTVSHAFIQADAVRSESQLAPGRYRIEYLGLEPAGDVTCTTDRPRREFSMLGNGATGLSFVFQCSAP